MNEIQLKRYFLDGMTSYMDDLIPNQIKQTWIRIFVCLTALMYLVIHVDDLASYYTTLVSFSISYLALQVYLLTHIKKKPLSFSRMLITPLFDTIFLGVAIVMDGGQFSPLYLAYVTAIMGTGMRFGNRSLIYTQILSVVAFSSACFYLHFIHQAPIDIPVFIIQMMGLLILPRYTHLANAHADDAFYTKKDAKSIAFQLLDKSPLAAFIFQYNDNKEICINYVNQALQDISPLPIEELIGYPIRSLFSIEDVQEVECACESILVDETQQPNFYIRTQGKSGTLQLLGNVRSFDFNHTRIGICFLTDITQQQQDTLKMHQNMQEGYMSTLVAGIVHDFRNVLTGIMGTAEMMQFSQRDRKTMDDLELIIQASEQGSRMVSNLLSLGQASQWESNEEKHDVMQALRSIVNLLRIQLP
ncbi:MAG: histidine kinase dimerization/phospho-acceptor domain-containing protein, partial [Mariprofundaceae bacterium]|nr:histidine kinase dimerization/phospho-acceptor domain-containing protein [Mariprofundaceae bacterium]